MGINQKKGIKNCNRQEELGQEQDDNVEPERYDANTKDEEGANTPQASKDPNVGLAGVGKAQTANPYQPNHGSDGSNNQA